MTENKLAAKQIVGRQDSRSELLGMARDYSRTVTDLILSDSAAENIIATGHQAVWHHCGIWAENLTTCKFARSLSGRSVHLVLDHDVCDTAMVLPRAAQDGILCSERIELELQQKAIPLELRRTPQQSRVTVFLDVVARGRLGQFCSDIWSEAGVLDAERLSCCNSVADLITWLQSVLNVALGIDVMYLPVSRLSESEAFLAFAASVVLDAVGFARAYNESLAKQTAKSKANCRDSVRVSKLDKTADLIQLPFWLHSPDGERKSLCAAFYGNDRIKIGTHLTMLGVVDSSSPEGKSRQLREILHRSGHRLRPKAVSLTLFVRLYLADWFVHGIGGSLYEPVVDHIIENYYRLGPLRFGTATCTMTLAPDSTVVPPEDNISQLKHTLHDIGHNPERYMDDSVLRREPIVSLLRAKAEKVAIATDRSLPADVRKSAWDALLKINGSLSESTKSTVRMIEKKIEECVKRRTSEEVSGSRKYFFGLFRENRLRELAQSLTFREPE